MNCNEFERLLDAYLEHDLTGSLRLEFDAHRLRCHHCQQTLAMMEAIGNTLASDSGIPELSDDFTRRVMADMRDVEPRGRRRLLTTRLAFAAGMVIQAAAVLTFAVLFQPGASDPQDDVVAIVTDAAPTTVVASARETRPTAQPLIAQPPERVDEMDRVGLHELIVETVCSRLSGMQDAGRTLTDDMVQIAHYVNYPLADDEFSDVATANPLMQLIDDFLVLPSAEAVESGATPSNEFSL